MRKIISLFLIAVMSLSMVACGGSSSSSTKELNELALVTDVGTIDDRSFNQGSWEGVVKYAQENNITHKYYVPTEKSNEAISAAIDLAIKGGAKTIVCPGYLFEVPVSEAQIKYPDINFIFVDGEPKDELGNAYIAPNTTSILYHEEQAGFLAGYAAVMDGYRNLGFMGGIPVPAVIRYGYGFVQGAEYAANELNINDINIRYTYVGNFDSSPDNVATAAAWYNEGTEIIFACGGGVGNSVMKAAESANKKVIGVDVDQSSESPTVITSAMKNLSNAIYTELGNIYAGSSNGGSKIVLGAETSDVLLPIDTSKFENFTVEQYEQIYAKLVNNEIEILDDTAAETADLLPFEMVVVNVQ